MAAQYQLPFFRFVLPVIAAAALTACGGGGSSSGGASALPAGTSADGRVAYQWAFEDANGNTTHQYLPVKNGVTTTVGTITTCGGGAVNCSVTQEGGKTGQGLRFNPTATSSFAWIDGGGTSSSAFGLCTSNVIEFGDSQGNLDYQMTTAMWINPDQINSTETYHLFGTGDPIGGISQKAASFHIRIVNGKVRLSMYPGNGYSATPDLTVDSATALVATTPGNNWHHVAVTYNNFAVVMYIDGKVDAVGTRDSDHRALCAAHRPYYVGGLSSLVRINGVWENASYIFPGVIDQLVLSNRAYTAAEIGKLAGVTP